MDGRVNESNVELYSGIIRDQARALFKVANKLSATQRHRSVRARTKRLQRIADDQLSRETREFIEQHHLISYAVFRCIRKNGRDWWELEKIVSNVDISHLDHIRIAENCRGYVLHTDPDEEDDVKTTMAENPNVVLLRDIFDWTQQEGDVWSQQIAWNGSFEECQRLAHLFDFGNTNRNSNTRSTSSIQLRIEHFHLHSELRNLYICLHETHPIPATIAAVQSARTVDICKEHVEIGDGGGSLCAICMEKFRIGETARQLPCNHLFHGFCTFQWFYRKLICPLCRREFHGPA